MPSSNSKLQTFLSDLRDARIALSAAAAKAKSARSALQEQILDCDTIASALPAQSLDILTDDLEVMLMDVEQMQEAAEAIKDIEDDFAILMKSTDPILQAVLGSIFEDQKSKEKEEVAPYTIRWYDTRRNAESE